MVCIHLRITRCAPDEYRLRVIFPQELLLLLDATGFRVQTRLGEFTREQFSASSPRQICLCTVLEENV